MANSRPIRRGRIPFRRGKRWLSKALHPVRWLDCNSTQRVGPPETGCESSNFASLCDPTNALELLVGDLDWDWSDASEVRIDRIVGTLSWHARGQINTASIDDAAPLIMRFGILATEETDRVYNAVDLFDPESIEEYEWMWIEQRTAGWNILSDAAGWRLNSAIDIPLDVRTRRKLGKKDSVILYTQTRRATGFAPATTVEWTSSITHTLRAIVRS